LLFAVGKGVQQSDAEARKWMKRAAAHGNADAKAFLGTYVKK
jgi:TPR repeat protein